MPIPGLVQASKKSNNKIQLQYCIIFLYSSHAPISRVSLLLESIPLFLLTHCLFFFLLLLFLCINQTFQNSFKNEEEETIIYLHIYTRIVDTESFLCSFRPSKREKCSKLNEGHLRDSLPTQWQPTVGYCY